MKPKRVILHCSATPDARSGHVNAALIDEWHKARGWSGIGYHYVVCRDGKIEVGRKEGSMGAHTKGHNRDTIGICYAGTQYPTAPQIESLIELYDEINSRHDISWKDWHGHYEFTNKLCPGFSMNVFRTLLREHDLWKLRRRNSCPMLTS